VIWPNSELASESASKIVTDHARSAYDQINPNGAFPCSASSSAHRQREIGGTVLGRVHARISKGYRPGKDLLSLYSDRWRTMPVLRVVT